MQGPLHLSEDGIWNSIVSGKPKANVDRELKNETQKQLRLEILESITDGNNTSSYLQVSTNVNEDEYKLIIYRTDNIYIPYRLDIQVVTGGRNELYSVYLSKNGEYLIKDFIPDIIFKTRKSLSDQDIEVEPKEESYTILNSGTSKIDDILLKFW